MNKMERRYYYESDEYYIQQMRTILHEFPHTAPPMYPVQLLDHVFIGSQSNADNIPLLKRLGITHVLNCAGLRRYDFNKSPYPPETGIKGFLMISATDHESFNIAKYFYEAIHFLDRVKKMEGRALVHCHLGVNRSGAIAAAYLMSDQQQTLLQVINYLKLKRFVVLTNTGFRHQLVQFARTKGLLDPICDAAEENEITDWPLLKSNIASLKQVTTSANFLRSLTLFDSTASSANRKDSNLKRYQRSWTVDKLITHCSENAMKKSRTFTRQSSLSDRRALPLSNNKTTTSHVEPIARHSLPTVEITKPSTETKQIANDTDRRAADKQTSLTCHRPSALTPVDERTADEAKASQSKISGFFTLLSSKRSPIRSTSYSNVSSSQQAFSQSTNCTITADETRTEESSAPLSTSRPLRVYTRSSTDSELYKTKSRYDRF